jgi:hypothetical protein
MRLRRCFLLVRSFVPNSAAICLLQRWQMKSRKAAGDARAFYVLTFHTSPSDRANEYHNIEVKVDQPGVTARTRTGFYLQP